MLETDLPAVLAVQRLAYGDGYQESAAVLGAKLRLAPAACWVADDGEGALGYVFSHPWGAMPPPLHTALSDVPADACAMFLHDLAVVPAGRGGGIAARLFDRVRARAVASGLERISLVALGDARAFWARRGFVSARGRAGDARLPAGYGAGAEFMELALPSGLSA